MRLFLLRHGETEWNREGRFQGALDSPLTELGHDQARHVARILRRHVLGEKINLVSSPRGRALQTATHISEALSLPIFEDDRLSEITGGSWDGLTLAEIAARDHEIFRRTTENNWYFHSPDGETYFQVYNRVVDWLQSLQQDTIAVAHGISGKILRGAYLKLSPKETLHLSEAQGCVFCLSDGQIDMLR